MKKTLVLILILLLINVVPIPTGQFRDGGTRCYTALTYKVVCWHRLLDDGTIFSKTSVYFFPEKDISLDQLFEMERSKNTN